MKKILILFLSVAFIFIFNGSDFLAKNHNIEEKSVKEVQPKSGDKLSQSKIHKMDSYNLAFSNISETDITVKEDSDIISRTQVQDRIREKALIEKIRVHTVRKGENLWEIARNYNINIDTIIGANDINNMNRIKPGDKLQILPVKGILYKIGPGESLWNISRKFDLSLNKIVKANNIQFPDRIKPGIMILLPGARPEFGYQDRLQRKFAVPVRARISSYYGGRWGRMHEGIDYAVRVGTRIRAADSGKIIYSGWASGYGKTVIIEHRKGLRTLYAHNSKLVAHSGQWVNRGQTIALSGNTGNSTGPHLHFEVQINGKPVNPLNYLR